jgi:hypothetical protein
MPTGTTVGLSAAVGLALAATALTTGWLSIRYDLNQNFLKWIVLPTVGYGIALAINAFVQQISCGSIRIEQIALGNLPILGAIFLFLLLTLIGAVRGPIEQAVDGAYRAQWGGIFAIAFYMFWAGMFGEAFAGGLAQSCGPQSSSSPLPK